MSIWPSIPEIQLFQIMTLKIQGHGYGRVKGQGQMVDPTLYKLISFSFHVNMTIHSWDTAWHLANMQISEF